MCKTDHEAEFLQVKISHDLRKDELNLRNDSFKQIKFAEHALSPENDSNRGYGDVRSIQINPGIIIRITINIDKLLKKNRK